MRFFCTYFDWNYLPRGLALYESLRAHAGDFELTVLCMDDETAANLSARALPEVRLLPLGELLAKYPELAAARADRTKLEFYFTCTPWLMVDLLANSPPGHLLTYLDADLFFFGSPDALFERLAGASIGIIPHSFGPSLAHLEKYGHFNVGWVSIRNDEPGVACAQDWAHKCAKWCFNRYEPGRYADQKYLDQWETDFDGVVQITHPGANVAPWNIKDRDPVWKASGLEISGQPLIFYHFHALALIGQNLYDSGLHRYDATLTPALRELVYWPYLRQLQAESREEGQTPPPDLIPPLDPQDSRGAFACQYLLKLQRESELDRAARLGSIHKLQNAIEQLRESHAVHIRAMEDTLAGTKSYLARVEADREAGLAAQQEMQKALSATGLKLHTAESRVREIEQSLAGTKSYLATVEADREQRLKALNEMQETLRITGLKLQIAEARVSEIEPALTGTRNYLASVEADRAARLSALNEMQESLRATGLKLQAAEARLSEIEPAFRGTKNYLETVEADRAARLAALHEMQETLRTTGLQLHAAETRLGEIEPKLAGTQEYLAAVESDRAERLQVVESLRDSLQKLSESHGATVTYLQAVEKDHASRLESILFYQQKLTEAYADLERNTSCLKDVQSENQALKVALQEKEELLLRADRERLPAIVK